MEEFPETWLDQVERLVERLWPSPEPTCFVEAPSAAVAPSHFYLVVLLHKMVPRLADEALLVVPLLCLHGTGHLNLEITITSKSLFQEAWDVKSFVLFLGWLHFQMIIIFRI